MKDITLKVVGKNQFEGQEADRLEFITEGKMFERSGSLYIVYEESELCGMPGCKTRIKLTSDMVKMCRYKADGSNGYEAEMEFEVGRRYKCKYETPYGPMDMELFTNEIENNISYEKGGVLHVDYHVGLKGLVEGRNMLTIEIN